MMGERLVVFHEQSLSRVRVLAAHDVSSSSFSSSQEWV
jgi:hypothetical protein